MHLSILVSEVPGYAELQREMHNALRAQHPEWVEADGKCRTCDSYEARFAELLVSYRTESGQACTPDLPGKETRFFLNPTTR